MCFMTINKLLMFLQTAGSVETCWRFSSGKFPWVDLNWSVYKVCPGHSTWTSPQTKKLLTRKEEKKTFNRESSARNFFVVPFLFLWKEFHIYLSSLRISTKEISIVSFHRKADQNAATVIRKFHACDRVATAF